MKQEYSRQIIEDDCDKRQIEQLHRVVLNFSNQSFEMKKMSVTLEVPALTLVTTVFKDNLSDPLYVRIVLMVGIGIPLLFFIIDAITYYYQDKLRKQMHIIDNRIRIRHGLELVRNERFDKSRSVLGEICNRIFRSVFEDSSQIYLWQIVLALLITMVFKLW